MSRPIRLLHLSDLHFAPKGFAFEDKNGQPDPIQLMSLLRRDPELETSPDAIVISGDVSSKGAPAGYEYAHRFIDALRDQWRDANLIIVPGNHDVDLSKPEDPHHAFVDMITRVYGDGVSQFYPFVSDGRLGPRHRLVSIQRIPGRLLIVAANSAADIKAEMTADGKRIINDSARLDTEALNFITEKLEELGDGGELRVFVMHHHLLPFIPDWGETIQSGSTPPALDASMVGNSAELQGWLGRNGFHVLLHGHKHKSHGRLDTLWRPGLREGAQVLIVGGGSAGVVQSERTPQPLSYNILSADRGVGTWAVHISVRKLDQSKEPGIKPSEDHSYSTVVGKPPESAPLIFHAGSTEDCHRAITQRTKDKGVLRNFISIVETAEYSHPPTVMLVSRKADRGDVEKAFMALHPEWDATQQVPNLKWRPHLDAQIHGYRFQHGPLMFNLPRPNDDVSSPVDLALNSLRAQHSSRAYVPVAHVNVGNPQVRELLTGLTGIQFIEDEKAQSLDLVATFRKLELSFWWAVNMYECSKLLHWAAAQLRKRKPGRITFFAALAEWKHDPEIPTMAELDKQGLQGIARIAHEVSTGVPSAKETLARWFREKANTTSDINIDPSGLHLLLQVAQGIHAADSQAGKPTIFSDAFLRKLATAEEVLSDALQKPDARDVTLKLSPAKKALMEIAQFLAGEAQAP